MASPTNPLLPRLFAVLLMGVLASAALRGGACFAKPLRVGTFNIREFGEQTDIARLATLIESTDVDVLGVQEIKSLPKLRELIALLSRRRFEFALTKCGGVSEMHVGFIYDAERVALVSKTEHQDLDPEPSDTCVRERPGLSARFERKSGGADFQLLVFHLVPGEKQQSKRRAQWKKAHVIAAKLAKETPIAILGDANSTGFLDDAGGERTFILNEAKEAGLDVATTAASCSEYYRLRRSDPLTPSLLDHIVTTPGLPRRGSVRVHGYCAELACKPTNSDPPDFTSISDHCPVTLDL